MALSGQEANHFIHVHVCMEVHHYLQAQSLLSFLKATLLAFYFCFDVFNFGGPTGDRQTEYNT